MVYGVSNVLRKRRESQPQWAIGFVSVVFIEQSERLSNIALRLLEVFPGFQQGTPIAAYRETIETI